jgi:hypothetical protein
MLKLSAPGVTVGLKGSKVITGAAAAMPIKEKIEKAATTYMSAFFRFIFITSLLSMTLANFYQLP